MRTREQYIEGLKKMKRNLYYNGSKIDRDDEEQLPSLNVMGFTFDAPHIPELRDLCTVKSHLTGETINRFCHIHQNPQDLHNKQDMTRTLCRTGRMCIQRCMGTDAINAVNAASFEADKQNNGSTQYHKNFIRWLENFQKNDLAGCCAQTDMKGERLKRPAEQTDPDMYLRVVEKKSDGIVVRGCKL
ncbi:MAG: aromatic ring hydroxylase, partial [Deltaproteobacteria bacterium HGW-Deltaproteobacteria-1]